MNSGATFRLFVLSAILLANSVWAQNSSTQLQSGDRKRADIAMTDLEPVLDGILDDEIWQQATVINDLHQTSPVDMGEPSQRSEFYVTYSEDYFYVAARLYDTEPELISARQMIQGGQTNFDDFAYVMLDTFNNNRTGFHFQTNPNGMRSESVYENPSSQNWDWSGIWQSASNIDEQGWTTEIAIPFTTLNFNPNTDTWGFNVGRDISRTNEEIAWSSFNRNSNPSTSGLISGIDGIQQGLGLDVVPSVTVAEQTDHTINDSEGRFDPSLDIFYKFTPNLTGALTFNTDFSATEADSRQVNFTRFGLFFEEKRDFFLQDSEIFSFGGLSGGGFGGNSNGMPFYSRRIGLDPSTGQPVDIEAGAKLAGRVDDISVGVLAVQQGDRVGLDGQNVFVGRVTSNVLAESKVGAIFTQGDPNSETDSNLAGVDFAYRNTRFTDRYTMTSDWWYQKSDVEGIEGDTKAYKGDVNFSTQNNGVSGSLSYNYIGNEFSPRLGFVSRSGIKQSSVFVNYRHYLPQSELIRNIFMASRYRRTESTITDKLETEEVFWRVINFNTYQGDQLYLSLNYDHDIPTTPFSILGVNFAPDDYSWNSATLSFDASNNRTFSPSLSYQTGGFYTGDRDRIEAGIVWRPNRRLALDFSYTFNDVVLPQARVISRQITLDASVAINPEWSWISLLQYENRSNTFGINSRLHWTPQAGEDFYLVVNYNFDSTAGAFREMNPLQSEIVLKYTRNFRF
tara:strand:+ start:31514 stop:33721 length:2208 start_codon:yes stop_codon:yes gene_type:complete